MTLKEKLCFSSKAGALQLESKKGVIANPKGEAISVFRRNREIAALTDSVQLDGYLKDMSRRDPELSKVWGQIATPLPFQTEGGHD